MFSHFKRDVSPLGVSVALLPALSYLQILSDLGDILLSFNNGGGTGKGSLPHLGPHQRCLTLSVIKGFEGSHLQTGLVAVIVRELGIGQTLFPIGPVGQHTLCLAIRLRVESYAVVQLGAHGSMQALPELGGKLWPSV
jgi:hypothetical protein